MTYRLTIQMYINYKSILFMANISCLWKWHFTNKVLQLRKYLTPSNVANLNIKMSSIVCIFHDITLIETGHYSLSLLLSLQNMKFPTKGRQETENLVSGNLHVCVRLGTVSRAGDKPNVHTGWGGMHIQTDLHSSIT